MARMFSLLIAHFYSLSHMSNFAISNFARVKKMGSGKERRLQDCSTTFTTDNTDIDYVKCKQIEAPFLGDDNRKY